MELDFNSNSSTSTRTVSTTSLNCECEIDSAFNLRNDDDSLLKQAASCIPDYRANEFKGSMSVAVAHKYCNVSGNLGPEALTRIATKTWLPNIGLVSPKDGYQSWVWFLPSCVSKFGLTLAPKDQRKANGYHVGKVEESRYWVRTMRETYKNSKKHN